MEDTAQPMAAETPLHDQLATAADALKQMRATVQDRDPETGRFAGEPAPVEGENPETEQEYDETEQPEADGPDEDQPEAVEMPKSWSKEDADLWHELPPSAQAKIAEREGQRDAAINSKFQEVANARKEYETKLAEATQSRDKWAQDYDLLLSDLSIPEPDPRAYGLGTPNYNRDAYDLAVLEWKQGSQQLQGLRQQREAIRAQQEQEANESWTARKAEIDAAYSPALLTLMPELTDRAKAEPAMRELVSYAIEQGLEPETFAEGNQAYITAAQLALVAKAKKYDELSRGTSKPLPKKQPAVRPGVATPRSATKKVARDRAMERLSTTGSIDDAAAAMRALRQR